VSRLPVWGRWLLAVTAVRAVFAALLPPTPEEAYHWNYARHLDWSYLDHPGMVAWPIALARLVFGDTAFAIRVVPLFFAAGTAVLLARLARRFYGEAASLWAVLLHLIQPVTYVTSASGYPDSPLLFFWALALTLVWDALETGRGIAWIQAGVALGFGLLSKYTIVFFGASVLGYLLTSRRDRRHLATPWPYLAAALSFVVFAPVLWWNHRHGWASFRYQSLERFGSMNEFHPKAFLKYLGLQWGSVLPLTLPLAAAAAWRGARSARPEERYLFWCFAPMMGFFAALSWTMPTHVLWPLPCWLGLMVLMAGMMAEGEETIGVAYRRAAPWIAGVTAAIALAASIHGVVQLPGIPPLSPTQGWDVAAARVRELRAELPPGNFVVGLGKKYFVASQLAFHLKAPFEVYGRPVLGQQELQYNFWTDPAALAGRDAAIVIEAGHEDPDALARSFRSVEPAGDLVIPLRGGKPLRFRLFRGRAYIPTPLPPEYPH
jgi:dolichol-phosphate mannosyltransferase